MKENEPFTREEIEDCLQDGEGLEEADLKKSKLRGINLFKTSLKGADLENADLSDADLRGANFEEANLQGAILIGANLTRANLAKANLERARLDMAILTKSDLSRASLRKASLYHALIAGADIFQADFTGANLREAYLNGAENALTAKFDDADLCETQVLATLLDTRELGKGAQGGSKHSEYRWKTKVFDFFKISWTEFMPGWFGWIFAPFRWMWGLIAGFFRLLTFPFRLFSRKKEPKKA